ncbi:MAG TPA: Ig-like domain-containing protein [Terriglobales bacterium]|nr:Ig-like domain-containing protein [Terriglobales bacterium]
MRQSAVLFSFFLIAAIAGCGGSGEYKNANGTLTTPALVSGGSSAAGSSSAAGTTTGGNTSVSGTSSTAGSSAAGNGAGTSTTSSSPSPSSTTSSAPEVVITSPADGATLSSPAQITVSVSGSAAVSSMQLYVDDGPSFQAASSQISTALQLPAGAHTLVAQAWDQNGTSYKSAPVRILVQGTASAAPAPPAPAPPAPPAPTAPTIGQIQTQGGWDNCDVCAGDAGNGPHTAHGMVQGVNSPSLSGASARFDVGGTPWGAALWWHELGSHDDAQNLRYDLDFYIDSTSSAQALEFDVNQTAGGSKYIFGTECDFRGTGTWRVWNGPAHGWSSTGLPCPVPETNTWHHLTWEFQRSGGQAHFIAVTLDGNRQDVGKSFSGIGAGGSGLDVAFQADLNAVGASESVWLDNLSLSW